MTHHRVFMLKPETSPARVPALASPMAARLPLDRRGRALTDLRISLTDRCNFRCAYCMPKEKFSSAHAFMPRSELLSFEEITRLARSFVSAGVRTLRLTGGEPLLRKDAEQLVARLRELDPPHGPPLDLAMTTNGSLLARKASLLRAAGLNRLTVSLDALDDAIFRRMNDAGFGVAQVLEGIAAAFDAGFASLKVNMVVRHGVNDQEIVPMARYFRERYGPRVELRFIEYMDVGASNGWRLEHVLPSAQVIARLHRHFELERVGAPRDSATANLWRYRDGRGQVGTISSVSEPFCGACSRARLSADGRLFTCLFSATGHDLKTALRRLPSDPSGNAQLTGLIQQLWQDRSDNYSERRAMRDAHIDAPPPARRMEMHYIGG